MPVIRSVVLRALCSFLPCTRSAASRSSSIASRRRSWMSLSVATRVASGIAPRPPRSSLQTSRADSNAFRMLSRTSSSVIARSMYGRALPVRSNSLSFALVMLRTSFRWFGSRFVPARNPRKLAALGLSLLVVAGCGGSGPPAVKAVRGTGYRFNAPAEWAVVRGGQAIQASEGLELVSVTRYPLVRRYKPSLWARVLPELDRAAAQLAKQQNGTVAESKTVTIGRQRARRYDIDYERDGKRLVERLAFVLRGKTEYLLLCRYERGGDTAACDRLLATFTLG